MRGTYFRWTRRHGAGELVADILGQDVSITADPATGLVQATVPGHPMDADTCRMVGVRLIEAAALADAGRSVREP
jgi:hypothetical protein